MKGEKIKILIIDDDNETREIYAEVFKDTGFNVVEAKDGLEGLDMATKENPDVVFTGIIMPRMDGFTMIEALKKNIATSKIPVVISSHMGREEDKKKAEKLGAKDFIVRGTTSPKQAVEKVKILFMKGEYDMEFNPYNLDAAKLARDLNINSNFQCMECNERMIMKVHLQDSKEGIFNAYFVCPKCGWMLKMR